MNKSTSRKQEIINPTFFQKGFYTRSQTNAHCILHYDCPMYCVYFGETSIHRFQHKVVNHIYIYIYIYSHVSPYFLALLHLPTCLGKGLKPFFLSVPAHLRPFSRSLLRESMMIWMCSLLSGQVNMLKHELLQPIFFCGL